MKFLNMLSDRNVIILMSIVVASILYELRNIMRRYFNNDIKEQIIKEHKDSLNNTIEATVTKKEVEITDEFTLYLIDYFSNTKFELFTIRQIEEHYIEHFEEIKKMANLSVYPEKEPLKTAILYFKQQTQKKKQQL